MGAPTARSDARMRPAACPAASAHRSSCARRSVGHLRHPRRETAVGVEHGSLASVQPIGAARPGQRRVAVPVRSTFRLFYFCFCVLCLCALCLFVCSMCVPCLFVCSLCVPCLFVCSMCVPCLFVCSVFVCVFYVCLCVLCLLVSAACSLFCVCLMSVCVSVPVHDIVPVLLPLCLVSRCSSEHLHDPSLSSLATSTAAAATETDIIITVSLCRRRIQRRFTYTTSRSNHSITNSISNSVISIGNGLLQQPGSSCTGMHWARK